MFPTPAAPERVGINVFGQGKDASFRRLVMEHARGASTFLSGLSDCQWSGGLYQDARGVRLKLYLTGELKRFLGQWGLDGFSAIPMALGVDLTEDGPQRHRGYFSQGSAEVEALFSHIDEPPPMAWPPESAAVSHGLCTVCPSTGKRSRNWLFFSVAPLSALRDALPMDHQTALDRVTRTSPGPGLEWAPVALESDHWPDGTSSLDWLLTIRTRRGAK